MTAHSVNSLGTELENQNLQNLTHDNRIAYVSKYNKQNQKDYPTKHSYQGNGSKAKDVPFHSMNSKPPVMMQTTDSPPLCCSLTCSPDRTIKKTISKDDSIAVTSAAANAAVIQSPAELKLKNLYCRECNASHEKAFIPYRSDANVGNCELCGCFRNITNLAQG